MIYYFTAVPLKLQPSGIFFGNVNEFYDNVLVNLSKFRLDFLQAGVGSPFHTHFILLSSIKRERKSPQRFSTGSPAYIRASAP